MQHIQKIVIVIIGAALGQAAIASVALAQAQQFVTATSSGFTRESACQDAVKAAQYQVIGLYKMQSFKCDCTNDPKDYNNPWSCMASVTMATGGQ